MIKSLHRFKSTLLIDQVVVSMHFLTKFFNVEEERGRAGEGNWRNKLCDEHQHYALASDHIIDDKEFHSPEEIAQFVIDNATAQFLNRVGSEIETSSDKESDFDENEKCRFLKEVKTARKEQGT